PARRKASVSGGRRPSTSRIRTSSRPRSRASACCETEWWSFRARDMLQLRPNCECCDKDLPPASPDALICSFECTFCRTCADTVLHGICPNCHGRLVARPTRVGPALQKHPASTERIHHTGPCR